MGIYERTGIRNIAVGTVDLITWVRRYGFSNGSAIFQSLLKAKEGFYKIKCRLFKNTIWQRDNYSDKAIFNQVFYERQYFINELSRINAKVIIDAGANIGLASVFFSQLYPSAQIIAVEPEAENFNLLQKNTSTYGVECIHAALWYQNEKLNIQNPTSLAASFIVQPDSTSDIEGITIPSLLERRQWDQVDILKMDIEGAEKEIFSNQPGWLKKVRLLIIELHDNYKPGTTKAFFKALESYNYRALFHHENIFIFFE